MATLGVLADTHIPDRAARLCPEALAIFKDRQVDAILHAGDITTPEVLAQLRQLAPVYAARGNRDWLALPGLPLSRFLTFESVPLVLTHGHGRLAQYLGDKIRFLFEGMRAERYRAYLLAAFPQARVIVYGHTHRADNQWIGEQLLFNPGSPQALDPKKVIPSLGILRIQAGAQVAGEIIQLL
jgi:putative phosphoesterase